MILVDTSVWMELLNRKGRSWISTEQLLQIVTCGPIVQEVLQGIRQGPAFAPLRDSLLALPRLSDPVPLYIYLEAAEIYRDGRRRGFTVRSSVDCLIAAIAIRNEVSVWHRDRDFAVIASYTTLQVVDQPDSIQ